MDMNVSENSRREFMTSPIQQNYQSLSQLQSSRFSPQSFQKGSTSYSEAVSMGSAADISFTTAEGDLVTLSNYQQQEYFFSSEKWISPLLQGMAFTSSVGSSDACSLKVIGDLSEDELIDIQNLMSDLTSIAQNFFGGNMDEAMNQALNISDMGSIAQLTASFSLQASWTTSSQTVDYHPVPTSASLEEYMADFFAELPDIIDQSHTDEMKYAEKLQAQWKQIKEYLEVRNSNLASNSVYSHPNFEKENLPAARQMMNRIKQSIARSPRLAPFASSLVQKAIDNQMENSANSTYFRHKGMLKDNFLQEFNEWMYEV